MSETTQKKSLQKHLKSGICSKQACEKVMHIIQLSHVLQVKLSRFFFYSNTYTDCLVADFPVLEHLCSTSLYPINFKKTCHVVGSEKLTEAVNA